MTITSATHATTVSAPAWPYRLRAMVTSYTSSYTFGKIFKTLLTVFFVTSLTFFIVRLIPGNPVEVYIQELQISQGLSYPDARDQAASLFQIDFDKPLYLQYFDYLGNLLRGNLGLSFRSTGTPVTTIIMRYLPWTVFSVGTALIISFSLGILLGMIVAYRRNGILDNLLPAIASVVSAIPNYLIAIIIISVLGVQTGILPYTKMRGSLSPGIQVGFTPDFVGDIFFHAFMPMLVYVLTTLGTWMLFMKSSTVSTLEEDYVTVARAYGLKDGRIATSYVGHKPGSNSFPSGHSASAFAGAFLLSRYYPRRSPLFYTIAGLVAFSRIDFGAHDPGEVVSGSAIGMGLVAVFRWLFASLRNTLDDGYCQRIVR